MQKNWFTIFNVKVTVKAYHFYYILKTTGLFTTKLAVIVQHHKPECPVQKLGYCLQDQGHSKGSKCK